MSVIERCWVVGVMGVGACGGPGWMMDVEDMDRNKDRYVFSNTRQLRGLSSLCGCQVRVCLFACHSWTCTDADMAACN